MILMKILKWIKTKDIIELFENTEQAPKAFEMKLEIVYEDQDLVIINKPAGIISEANIHLQPTVFNQVSSPCFAMK